MLEYQRHRNALLAALRPYGTVGPMGDFPVELGEAGWKKWAIETEDPDFFVVDVRMSNTRAFLRVEVETNYAPTMELLNDLWKLASSSKYVDVFLVFPGRLSVIVSSDLLWCRVEDGPMPKTVKEMLKMAREDAVSLGSKATGTE